MMNRFAEADICGGDHAKKGISMKRLLLNCWCLWVAGVGVYAQNWTQEDSIRLQRLLNQEGEIQLNKDALEELDRLFQGKPQVSGEKAWMEYNDSVKALPRKPKLTLMPYTSNTPYNWDPVRQEKIDFDKPMVVMTLPALPVDAYTPRPSGIDLMKIFSKDFWQRKKRRERKRTHEALREYGNPLPLRQKAQTR